MFNDPAVPIVSSLSSTTCTRHRCVLCFWLYIWSLSFYQVDARLWFRFSNPSWNLLTSEHLFICIECSIYNYDCNYNRTFNVRHLMNTIQWLQSTMNTLSFVGDGKPKTPQKPRRAGGAKKGQLIPRSSIKVLEKDPFLYSKYILASCSVF